MTMFIHPDDPSYAELEAERDALKAELREMTSERNVHRTGYTAMRKDCVEARAENERLRAEVASQAQTVSDVAATGRLWNEQLTALREAAEAVRDRHELETLVTPEAIRFCDVLDKLPR